MTKLTNNPSPAITANGEYECHSEYRGGDPVILEVSGSRGGGSIQPGLVDVDGQFAPAAAAVSGSDPSQWKIELGATGKLAVKIAGATAPSLKVATTPARA